MAKAKTTNTKTTTTTKRQKKVGAGQKKCPNCGGDGVVKIRKGG